MAELRNLLKKAESNTFFSDKDVRQLFCYLLIYWLAWTLTVGLLPLSMVLDSVEEVVWSQTWQRGYYKHPPLPSILIAGLNHLLAGPAIWLTVFAAQGCAVVALLYVWLLAKKILPNKLAIVAVLITSLIGYHNYSATSFDHNTVSLPVSAAVLYYFYCAIHQPERIFNWLIVGVAAGLAMLTKYSALLVIAGPFVYLIWQRLWLNLLIIRGLVVSILMFGLVLSPHVSWLMKHDWLPFHYFNNELVTQFSRTEIFSRFLVGQILPFLPIFLTVWLLSKIRPHRPITVDASKSYGSGDDWRFLMATLFTPLILALLPTLINGTFLCRNWVSAFFLPTGIAIVKRFFCQYNQAQLLRNTCRVVWPLQTLILLVFVVGKIVYPAKLGRDVRTNFPSQLLAERVAKIWREHQRQPLAIVIADTWLAGNLLLHTRPEPAVLLNNDIAISTWLNRQDVANCGALVLTTIEEKDTSAYSTLFHRAVATGIFSLPWGNVPHEYAWAVLSPESSDSYCRLNEV